MNFSQPIPLHSLATLLDATIEGDPQILVKGLNEIHMVEPGDLTFADHPKYYQKALDSKASVILIDQKVDFPIGKALLIHSDPFEAYISLVRQFHPFHPSSSMISPLAVIGEGTVVQPGVFIGNDVVIGKNCLIHANVSIYDHTIIGDRVIIHSGSVLGADAYYFQNHQGHYRKLESCGKVIVGNDVEIGALCAIDKGVSAETYIGDGTKMDNHVQIGHDTHIGRNCLIGAHSAIAGVTTLEDNVILWARVSINKDLVIGKGAVLLATSSVSKSLEGGKTYFGAPAIEARAKWRELVALKQLPDLLQKLHSLLKD